MPVYVDDCFVIELDGATNSAYAAATGLISPRGFDIGKPTTPSETTELLGAEFANRKDGVSARVPKSRRDGVTGDLEKILAPVYLSPGLAA